MKNAGLILFSLALVLIFAPADFAQDTCYADLDINGDGLPLSVSDYILLMRTYYGDTVATFDWYHVDLNGDCVIDDADIELIDCYFRNGLECFGGVFPVPTCCSPSLVTGACCLGEDSCTNRSEENCALIGGQYQGHGIECAAGTCSCCRNLRGNFDGDVNDDVNISDVVYFVNHLFRDGPPPPCFEEADVNGDGSINIADLVEVIIPFLFTGQLDLPPCAQTYPVTHRYTAELFDQTDGSLVRSFTVEITYYGPDAWTIDGALSPDSDPAALRGTGSPHGSISFANSDMVNDAGFQADMAGGIYLKTGVWMWTTIAGTEAYDAIMVLTE